MHRTRRALISALLATLTIAGTVGGATAATAATTPGATPLVTASDEAPSTRLSLPRPTGPYPVGTSTLHLVDHDRLDPWVPESGDRQLMVSMYYPAAVAVGRPSRYMTSDEATALLGGLGLGDVEAGALSGTRTHALVDAPPLPRPRALPLVVLSPGFTLSRATLTGLAEDLASRGYVVATVDHAHETYGTTFPGGRVTPCVACEVDAPDLGDRVTEGRSADVSFVLDRLTGPNPAWHGSWLIDSSRIAMVGHSVGGASAARTMLEDDRVDAGANMDGSFFTDLTGLDRPFLMLGAPGPGGADDPSWVREWEHLTGWKRWLALTGSGHFSFIDFPLLAAQLGVTDPSVPLAGDRSMEITRAYVGAFLDQHLRGRSRPLLDGPSEAFPEVTFKPAG
ncbi:alpha/beta hydrolase family protein [Allostreptomyces psammosilenae]|uniref:Dienelactone hydrolase n=1 Tax=Allostreptomyces psammosilenae TaxID=1892865 RepID=A0A853A936_9ACTN|nr:alpha/beta hydrolase [Allostreptomyces psammosilenae]NYI06932.1 dienelactone hydrolase [Allostreptomyces psammosilenae]